MKRQLGLSEMVHQREMRASRRATHGALGMWAWSSEGGLRSPSRRGQEPHAQRPLKRGRRGSTLLVVLGLLGMLSLLGLIYFSFANQEQQNATYFAEAAKGTYQEDDIERIFGEAIKQITIGAEPTQPNSVMWGRRHSMLYNLIGWDVQPHTGTGVHLILDGSGGLVVDQNYDGSDDVPGPNDDLRNVNDSPAAHFQFQRNVLAMPAPDVDYTYPDINNMFLGYKGYTWDYRLNPPAQRLVIKPAFHRPELFRNGSGQPVADWAISQSTSRRSFRPHPFHSYVWRQDTSGTPQRRFIIDASSNPAADPTLAGFVAADAALIGASVTNQVSSAFPFLVNLNDPVTGTPDAFRSEQGVFSADGNMHPIPGAGNVTAWNQYEYDVDNDGDGVMDGIWMDFDMPILVRPSDNRPYIPLISTAIYDLDSLLNANMVGNTFGDTRTNNTSNFGNGGPISVSAQGLSSPAEINPLYALDTTYAEASSAAQTDLTSYFGYAPTPGASAIRLDMANMEFWTSLKGHVRFSTPNQIYAGRFGEANRMWSVLQAAGAGAPIGVQNSVNSNLFPYPGQFDLDDNRDANEGHRNWMGGTAVGQIQSFRHPLLFGGRGRYWTTGATGPKSPMLYSVATSPLTFLQYQDVFNGFDALNSGTALTGTPQWFGLTPFGAPPSNPLMTYTNPATLPIYGANFGVPIGGAPFPNPASVNDYYLVDDSMEVTVDPKSEQRPYDEPFEAIDTLYLQMTNADRNSTGLTSRLADTMPANLVIPTGASSPNQVEVGQRFTSLSWDLKHFGLRRHSGTGSDRVWEFNVDFDGDGNLEFPPQFNPVLPGAGGTPYVPAIDPSAATYLPENAYGPRDPFRPQLRRLLSFESGSTTDAATPKRLSINEFLDVERRPGTTPSSYTSQLQYRQLTPHSTDSAVQNLPTPTANTINQAFKEPYTLPAFPPAATGMHSIEEVKEFWARRDRQQMARDIYVLLYTFCGGNDSVNVSPLGGGAAVPTTGNLTTNSGLEVHPGNVRRQMAQFAVNFVDALDTDNVITAFEFDHNLQDGWDLDDDPATTDTTNVLTGEREVVYGVETPQLTFSEAAWYRQSQQASNNSQTPYDDTVGEFNFVQLELRSIFPETVQLADRLSTTAATGIWRILRDDNNNGILDDNTAMVPNERENAVVFLNPAGSIAPGGLYTIASSDAGSLGPGGFQSSLIYIDHAGATTDFEMVCPNVATAGAYTGAAQPANGIVNLDLLHPNDTPKFTLAFGIAGDFLSRNNNPTLNTQAAPAYFENHLTHTVFALQRRLNPRLPQLSLVNNPYVTVDAFDRDGRVAPGKMGVKMMDLNFDGSVTDQTTALARLENDELRSTERGQPLKNIKVAGDTDDLELSGNVTPGMMKTTFTLNNSKSPAQFNHRYSFLPHFDRDYSSIVELLHIPLFGPGTLTRDAQAMWLPPELDPGGAGNDLGQVGATIDPTAANKTYSGPLSFGAAVFLQSEDRDHDGMLEASEDANGNGLLDPMEDTNSNGWLDYGDDLNKNGVLDSHPYHFHRFFAFAEVPTRTHRQLGDPLQQHRVPARINLNGVRDPRVLAGLIDDLQVHGIPERDLGGPNPGYTEDKNLNGVLDVGEDLNGNGTLDAVPPDPNEDINGNGRWDRTLADVTGSDARRDWWGNFLLSRDGLDPTSQMFLPLSGTSRPFRDFGLTPNGNSTTSNVSLEDSILRRIPQTIPADRRRLFELTNQSEFTFPTSGATAVSPLIQHRLLSKMVGNTTTRSNCFVVFVTIGMFECVQFTPPGTTEPVTRIGGPLLNGTTPVTYRKAYIVDRSVALEASDQGTGSFDWRKLVMAQQRIK